MAFSFNLCSTAFIDYVFADPEYFPGRASPEFIDYALASRSRPQTVNVPHRHDRLHSRATTGV